MRLESDLLGKRQPNYLKGVDVFWRVHYVPQVRGLQRNHLLYGRRGEQSPWCGFQPKANAPPLAVEWRSWPARERGLPPSWHFGAIDEDTELSLVGDAGFLASLLWVAGSAVGLFAFLDSIASPKSKDEIIRGRAVRCERY